MKRKLYLLILCVVFISLLSTSAFAVTESEVETAIAASGEDAVAGNLFIWFLCAVGFLKISQKIDSFMTSLGINVGRTGGSMMAELLIAGRALGGAAMATGSAIGNIFNRGHSSTRNHATGQAFTGSGGGIIGVAKRTAGNVAASSATDRGAGLGAVVGGAMFGSSLNSGGKFATDVVGAVATGNIAAVGSIKGEKAAQALTSYLGYGTGGNDVASIPGEPVGTMADSTAPISGPEFSGSDRGSLTEDRITLHGGTAASRVANEAMHGNAEAQNTISQQPPTFRDVEIGGGRITGYETAGGDSEERQFAMYNANQYMAPSGEYDTVQTADGENWYKQYAQPVVEKKPYEESPGQIKYHERIVEQMPQVPKRKDKI